VELCPVIYQWRQKKKTANEVVEGLSESLSISTSAAELLVQRGVETFDQAKDYFRPDLNHIHDPFLMADMEKAIDRIEYAIANKQKILIYGDYDVDGTTSVATVYSFFKKLTSDIDYYIPDRFSEGYGISEKGVRYAAEENYSVVIALDCGIRSMEMMKLANELGVDFIICDHHIPGNELPAAYAILDPKRKDCDYPFKELSGCGVGFKLLQAYCIKFELEDEIFLENLDLLAVSIASDIVPIVDENRTLAYYGLKKLNENPGIGIQALTSEMSQKPRITISDIVFGIGPRINAAGRMKDAKTAVELLVQTEYHKALNIANSLNSINADRKEVDKFITESALEKINNDAGNGNRKTTVVGDEGWNKGVIGIVASRLIEHHYRPTVVFSDTNGVMTGSARSVKGFNIHTAIEACSEAVEQFGGHKYAAGLTIKRENFERFKDLFEREVAATIKEEDLIPTIEYDIEMNFDDVRPKFLNIMDQMRPFGPSNMQPVFVTRNVKNAGSYIVKESHLKLKVAKNNLPLEGIAFGMADKLEILKKGEVDVCYNLEWNEFRGRKTIQMKVKDIKPSESL
jgi:single-stranded-DNA-specific exonuclease